jgi:hypothetical protein
MATTQIWRYPESVRTDRNLSGYEVEARDGSIGSIDEATQDIDEYWVIVDTGPWIFGKRVLLPAGLVERVDHDEQQVFINRTRDEIKNAPEYDVSVGASGPYRQELGSYYAAPSPVERRPVAREATRTGGRTQRSQRSRSSARSRSGSSTGSKSSSKSRRRTSSRSRTSDEPTKDELYAEAKRLDIPNRSKMSKTALKQAVSRRRGRSSGKSPSRGRSTASSSRGRGQSRTTTSRAKANPVEVQAFLDGVSYPTRRGDLVREAERSGASRKVRSTLERLPEERFDTPTEVSEAIGKLR